MPEQTHVYDLYIANRASVLLAVSVRLGVFALLDAGPCSREHVRDALEITGRGVDALLIGLESMGLLSESEAGWKTTPVASRELVPGKEGYLGALIDLENDHILTPERLLGALRGTSAAYDSEDVWAEHDADPEKAQRFTAAMHSISSVPAAALSETIDLSQSRHLLDVGGGSGVFVVAFLNAWAGLRRATVLDIPAVCRLAREVFEREGVSDRGTTQDADMFSDPWPRCDALLFSQILHDWDIPTGARLLAQAFDALEPGGQILVHEKLLERPGPLANAMVSLDMLYWTEGQQYTATQLETMLRQAGFDDVEVVPTVGYWSVTRAWKRK